MSIRFFNSGVSLKAPRTPGKFNHWVLRMATLKLVASKRRLTKMLSHISSFRFLEFLDLGVYRLYGVFSCVGITLRGGGFWYCN